MANPLAVLAVASSEQGIGRIVVCIPIQFLLPFSDLST